MARERGHGRRRGAGFVLAALTCALITVLAQGCKLKKPTDRQFGDACGNDYECESGSCTPAGEFCTKPCTYDRDCGKGLVCRHDSTAAGHSCAKPIGALAGGACERPEGCASGHCLKLKVEENASGVCSTTCMTPADCPVGLKVCDRVAGAGIIKLCLPDGNAQPQQQQAQPQPQASASGSAKSNEHIGWVKVKNPRTTVANVEYRVGQKPNCMKNTDAVGAKAIPAGETWTLEARGESMVCIRLQGSTKWWKNRVNHGQTHNWVID
ncbi:MAG TPA: hypothetical protein VGM56_16330 [Byssovorax sp.]|jgi:hypothetical protein